MYHTGNNLHYGLTCPGLQPLARISVPRRIPAMRRPATMPRSTRWGRFTGTETRVNVPTPFLSLDRCDVLLAAGLASDALAEADAALGVIEQTHGWPTRKAELLMAAANCA